MAARSTTLVPFSTMGNSRTSIYTGHTSVKPKVVIEKRKVPEGNQEMVEFSFKVVNATVENGGTAILPQKISFESVVRYPIHGTISEVSAALAIFRDIVAGDEFAASLTSQTWL